MPASGPLTPALLEAAQDLGAERCAALAPGHSAADGGTGGHGVPVRLRPLRRRLRHAAVHRRHGGVMLGVQIQASFIADRRLAPRRGHLVPDAAGLRARLRPRGARPAPAAARSHPVVQTDGGAQRSAATGGDRHRRGPVSCSLPLAVVVLFSFHSTAGCRSPSRASRFAGTEQVLRRPEFLHATRHSPDRGLGRRRSDAGRWARSPPTGSAARPLGCAHRWRCSSSCRSPCRACSSASRSSSSSRDSRSSCRW